MLVIDRSDSRHFLLLVLGEALLKRVFPGVLAAAGVLLELGLAGGREEGLLADVADDVHGLLVLFIEYHISNLLLVAHTRHGVPTLLS